jgi:hypothetical protein
LLGLLRGLLSYDAVTRHLVVRLYRSLLSKRLKVLFRIFLIIELSWLGTATMESQIPNYNIMALSALFWCIRVLKVGLLWCRLIATT